MEQQTLSTPIVIHPHTLQKFMRRGKDFANLLALYTFYTYHAQLQKTNSPLATDEFVKNGLNWAIDRVKRIKKILKDMKLIEVVQRGKYYYIRLIFIYTKNKIDEILNKTTPKEQKKEEIKKDTKPIRNHLPTPKQEQKPYLRIHCVAHP